MALWHCKMDKLLTFGVTSVFVFKVFVMVAATVEFTNIKCNDMGKEHADVYDCRIVDANRSYKYITVKLHLLKPVTDCKINFAWMKRLNGYKPFLYNQTYDGCNLLKTKKGNPVVKFFFSFFDDFSNFDHPCPYDHDIIFDKLSTVHMNDKLTKQLPMPHGEYAFYTLWILNGKLEVDVRVYLTIS